MADSDTNTKYQVVINDEAQYSIWQADREIPLGWRAIGVSGSRADCEAHVAQQTELHHADTRNAADDYRDAGQ